MVCNQKYSLLTFLPLALYGQFKYFFNLYFLMVALTQLYPPFQVGFAFTYFVPLSMVVFLALVKEAHDDLQRYWHDRAANGARYDAFVKGKRRLVASQDIRVGMVLRLAPGQRVPADCVLLKTTEAGGSFIKTDQLDGETDWKLRLPVPFTQTLSDDAVVARRLQIWCEAPHDRIYEFSAEAVGDAGIKFSLRLENTLWASTTVASGTVLACVVYTGHDTRARIANTQPTSKFGVIDRQLNGLSKALFAFTVGLAFLMAWLRGLVGEWHIAFFRFIVLFSSIIPVSLRVNLDMGKAVFSYWMMTDPRMKGVQVRNSAIPEELGRLGWLFADKTGTLTKNKMAFKKVVVGGRAPAACAAADRLRMARAVSLCFGEEGLAEGVPRVRFGMDEGSDADGAELSQAAREDLSHAMLCMAVTHGITPVSSVERDRPSRALHGSSADEIALVATCEAAGLTLEHREQTCLTLLSPPRVAALTEPLSCRDVHLGTPTEKRAPLRFITAGPHAGWYLETLNNTADLPSLGCPVDEFIARKAAAGGVPAVLRKRRRFEILLELPFNSDDARMGVVLRDVDSGEARLFVKGSDARMVPLVDPVPWLEEESSNLAREGLRTLVFASKKLSPADVEGCVKEYGAAVMRSNHEAAAAARAKLEKGLVLAGVTGVEDTLQDNVAQTIEHLRKGGVRVWMLTGDKLETAACIARATRLTERDGVRFPAASKRLETEENALSFLEDFEQTAKSAVVSRGREGGVTLMLEGSNLPVLLSSGVEGRFVEAAKLASSVVVARCSPAQKAGVVRAVMKHVEGEKTRCAAIGDGGNDVPMIRTAHVGIGVEGGREGNHASLAADFSVRQFSTVLRLATWHGRNSYARSARLSQFVIHRGLTISFIQAIFTAVFYFMAVPIYTGLLPVGYTTLYTMFPVFAMVTDEDVSSDAVFAFPELYKELQKARILNLRTFLQWVFRALYQGTVIMVGAITLFDRALYHIVTVSFTALIITELATVWLEMHRLTPPFVIAEIGSLLIYAASFHFLPTLDESLLRSSDFWWKVGVVTSASVVPVVLVQCASRCCYEPPYSVKLQGESIGESDLPRTVPKARNPMKTYETLADDEADDQVGEDRAEIV
ncbi:putative phospholipid-transporting ATPase NEO1 [Diplonema papillatum]|nr:putative phospholipid-transporting ATPase NEO1 [Diplonema papillatum]